MAGNDVPEHVRWAVEVLAPRQDERVLDIGSGTGASVELILEAVAGARGRTGTASRSTGSTGDAASAESAAEVVAIDRSSTAVQRIRQRLSAEVEHGTMLVLHTDLAALVPSRSAIHS